MTEPKMVLCGAQWINCSVYFLLLKTTKKSHEYQQKFENKQETFLHVTNSRSAEPLTKESHGWKNCLYVFTSRLDKH